MITMVDPKLLGIGSSVVWWERLELGPDSKKKSSNITLITSRFMKKLVSLSITCGWVIAPAAQGCAQKGNSVPTNSYFNVLHRSSFPWDSAIFPWSSKAGFRIFLELIPSIPAGFQNPQILSIHPQFPTCGSFLCHPYILYSASKDVQYFVLDFFLISCA